MLFQTLEFAVFLTAVFTLYWLIPPRQIRLQNFLILLSSYVFYAWWDWRFLSLIIISTAVDYTVARLLSLAKSSRSRRALLLVSLATNLGLLAVFKYYNFFAESLVDAMRILNVDLSLPSLRFVLPVGISFYTFQTLSYSIDVYKGHIEPETDLIAFGAFVAFFPQLVAGPIERARNLLPQFKRERAFTYDRAVDGVRQGLWGLFKKVAVADSCARLADMFFSDPGAYAGSTLLLGMVFFAFQIYGDFSGYSDMAIGTARLLGFDLMRNFAYPYFSRDIAEFWRRWHLSLTTWFRDYVYIPLGGSKQGKWRQARNTIVVFLVSGLWHGANWTFVLWGGLNALLFLPRLLRERTERNVQAVAAGRRLPSMRETSGILLTFGTTLICWVFFRAASLADAFLYLEGVFSLSLFTIPRFEGRRGALIALVLIGFLVSIEWIGRHCDYGIQWVANRSRPVSRLVLYYSILGAILWFGGPEQQFIYFQF